jgi:excisionase family DNA binding protein
METSSPLLTTREVADMLRLSRSRVQELVTEDALRPVRVTPTSHLRFGKDEIEALITPADVDPEPTR